MNNQAQRIKGRVKWYNKPKGYGFITPDTGGNDIFVHISEVERANLAELTEGESVSFTIGESARKAGKPVAQDLRRENAEAVAA